MRTVLWTDIREILRSRWSQRLNLLYEYRDGYVYVRRGFAHI